MKHVFSIYSNLHFLVSHQFIKENGFSADDCVFILNRGINIPNEYENHYKTFSYPTDFYPDHSTRALPKFNVIKGHKNIRHIENVLHSFIMDSNFLLYVPCTANWDFISVLASEKNCRGYYLLEEGTISYIEYEEIQRIQPFWSPLQKIIFKLVLKPFLYRFYCLRDDYFVTESPKYKGAVAVSEKTFPNYPKGKIVVKCPFIDETTHYEKYDAILSIDTLTRNFDIDTIKELYISLKKHFDHVGYKRIACKFHPVFFMDMNKHKQYKDLITSIFGANTVEIEKNTLLECLLISTKADFYTDFSSSGFYPAQFGVNCYSYYPLLKGKNEEYDSFYNNLPPCVKGVFQQI